MGYVAKSATYVALSLLGVWLIELTSNYLKKDYTMMIATVAFCNTIYIAVMK